MSQEVQREVTIISRYYIKKSGIYNDVLYVSGSVVLLVENDKGVRYTVTIRPNKIHSCTCDAFAEKKGNGKHLCYHIKHCRTLENARERAAKKELTAIENAKVAAAEQELAAIEAARTLAKEVEAIVVEAEKELAREVVPARDKAPLNGNRAFSLLHR